MQELEVARTRAVLAGDTPEARERELESAAERLGLAGGIPTAEALDRLRSLGAEFERVEERARQAAIATAAGPKHENYRAALSDEERAKRRRRGKAARRARARSRRG